ncbi:hypothetical protein VB711_01710 [Cronbergia sp. UHCC 0137]|uniref:hypothetical protein n=1 Tax=Cronbergia sp. UHCC 0137 TaxID=3110239 RepID=UPI002B204B21|nr:hypothetical protein [Cronbergia sp. UHCC 0137]MEA5616559.1 hypothetical protein [Cronbergia sp. UHCC 0137]
MSTLIEMLLPCPGQIPASISMIRENHNNFFGETGINNFLFIEFENTFSEIMAQTVQSANIDEIEF